MMMQVYRVRHHEELPQQDTDYPYYIIHASIFSFSVDAMMEREGPGGNQHKLSSRAGQIGCGRTGSQIQKVLPALFEVSAGFNSSEQSSKLTSSFG
jgi:hypothetical protein